MADDSIRVTPDNVNVGSGSGQGVGKLIKAFTSSDVNGNTVETQAVALVGTNGELLEPLTEDTGKAIVALLRQIDQKLAVLTGGLPAQDAGGITIGA